MSDMSGGAALRPPLQYTPGSLAAPQAQAQAQAQLHVTQPMPTSKGKEACRSNLHACDPLYNLLAKQAADDYFMRTDTVDESIPDTTHGPVHDASTTTKISEAWSPEISVDADDNVDIQPTESQHQLHNSAEQSHTGSINGSESVVILPTISPSDYDSDEEFGTMYHYLKYDILTGNVRQDKTILIMAE